MLYFRLETTQLEALQAVQDIIAASQQAAMDCSQEEGEEDPRVESKDEDKRRERAAAKGKWAAEESSDSSSSDSDDEPIDPSVRLGRMLERADIRGLHPSTYHSKDII